MRARAERYLCGEHPTKKAFATKRRYVIRKKIHEIGYKNIVRTHQVGTTDPFADFDKQLFGKRHKCDNGK